MKGGIDIYYDEEGDFLEITIMPPPIDSYCEDIDDDIFMRKNSKTDEIVGIGILNFKINSQNLKEKLKNIPIKINFETVV